MLFELKRYKYISYVLIFFLLWHLAVDSVYALENNTPISASSPKLTKNNPTSHNPHNTIQFDTLLTELKEVTRQAQSEGDSQKEAEKLKDMVSLKKETD